MIVPNLARDHVSPIALARVSDVQEAIIERPYGYDIAARSIGLTPKEYAAFRRAIADGDASYAPLPRHIDAMSGRRTRDGHIYVLRHVVVPAGTMGWIVPLEDGTIVFVPRACGNLSMSRGHRVAHSQLFTNVSYKGYFQPVVFAPPVAPTPYASAGSSAASVPAAPALNSPPVESRKTGFPFGFLAPLFPIAAAVLNAGGTPVPRCSLGSNIQGVCR